MAGNVVISGQVTGTPQGNITVGPISITPTASNLSATTTLILANGDNTITVPTWAKVMLIQPSTLNAVQITLKGAGGDTGIPLSLTAPSLVTFPASPPANVILNNAAPGVQSTEISFY